MRKAIFGFLLIAAAAFPQQLSHEVRVINIEVPVRVFKGDQFIDHLTLQDFDVYEDGEPQKIEAVYLIKKTNLERKEEKTIFTPETSRSFYLFFNLYEPDPQVQKALAYFFQNVLTPDDHLLVIGPRAVYDPQKEIAAKIPAEKIVAGLDKKLRNDILAENSAYLSVLAHLKRMAGIGGIGRPADPAVLSRRDRAEMPDAGTLQEYLMRYYEQVDHLERLRTIDDEKFLDLARTLKKAAGQKIVFYFYQKEYVPLPDLEILRQYGDNLFVQSLVSELSGMSNRKAPLPMDRLKKLFADSFFNVQFLYLDKNPADLPERQIMERKDVFSTFDEIAKATGGLSARSANANYLMQQASQAAENYYLLYYSPKDKTADGKFRTVTVRVKSGNYRVAHLAGYFAK
jgi:hypothetical protein